jgi:hypothetical protein
MTRGRETGNCDGVWSNSSNNEWYIPKKEAMEKELEDYFVQELLDDV